MTETVAEALSRHEADCPVCQANYREHCHDRETVGELAELRVALAAAEAERDAALERVKVVELRSAASAVDVGKSDNLDYIMTRADEIAAQIRDGTFKLDVRQNDDGTFSVHEERIDSISGLFLVMREMVKCARDNFNACARLEAQVRDLTGERDEAIAERDRYLTRAVVAEAKVAKVRAVAISEQGPFLDRSEPPENENYNCGKWDAARTILTAIGGPNV